MKYLLTSCPRCRNRFYIEIGKVTEYDIVCPYCKFRFRDQFDPKRTKEVDYHWELYEGLYSPLKKGFGKDYLLKISGGLMFLMVGIFLFVIFQLRDVLFIIPANMEQSTEVGLGLAGMIFIIFIIVGAWSCLKKYSFTLSSVGAFFGALSAIFWLALKQLTASNFATTGCFLLLTPFILSLITLYLIIKNKRSFSIGY